ncbi:MAG: AMP-binding protein [Cyclobacteriaceae bacterium]
MKIVFKNEKLTIDEVRTGKSFKNIYEDHESQVINIVKKWYSDKDYMEFVTSGSTGVSKVIRLSKDKMKYSADVTMQHIDPDQKLTHAVLCISPTFIGGAMLVIRAIQSGIDLIVEKPNAIPSIPGHSGLVSMVPLQVMKSIDSDKDFFDQRHTILIGGAPLPERYLSQLQEKNVDAYITYGMTETASHVALKNILKSDDFQVLGDSRIDSDHRDCLKIKGTLTDHEWLQTNDIVTLTSDTSFRWIGRADFVINTGGYKVNPEAVEEILQEAIKKPILIAPEVDEILGQKVILLIESDKPFDIDHSIFNRLHAYSKPKRIVFAGSFIYTSTGKIDRLKTAKKYLK